MSVSTLTAEIRTELGKGPARRTRRAGQVPAVLYGHGETPKHLALPAKEFASAIRYGGMTQVLTIKITDGTTATVLPKAIQRDALKDIYTHADLLLVRKGEKITVEIPVTLVGEAAKGTLIMYEHDRLAINADATRLPDHVEASVDGLEAGDRVTAADIPLPQGAELAVEPDIVIAIVSQAPTAEQMEAEGAGGAEAPAAAAGVPAETPAETPTESGPSAEASSSES